MMAAQQLWLYGIPMNYILKMEKSRGFPGGSVVYRIHLPMQETRVQSLAWEDPAYPGVTKPLHHNY